jgi:hypothetical protein
MRLVTRYLGLQRGDFALADVGRIRDDQVERAERPRFVQSIETVGSSKSHPAAKPQAIGVAMADLKRGGRNVGRDDLCVRCVGRDRDRDRPGAGA